MSEGKKMFWSVMAIVVIYAVIFIIFEDYDRRTHPPREAGAAGHYAPRVDTEYRP